MRIYTYNCEFPLVEMHLKMCISAVRIYTNFGVLPHAEIHSLMWIPTWGKCISPEADLHSFKWITACGNTQKYV